MSYPIYHTVQFFKNIPMHVKHGIQKLLYGISERATWSLDMSIAKHILKDLKAFERWGLKDKYGYPVWLYGGVHTDVMYIPDEEEDDTNKLVWIAIIHRLILGFERIATGDYICIGYEEYDEETVALFEVVLPSLWT